MRTSTRTPRMSWFKCTPVDFLTDTDFLAMNAAARGAYFMLMLYGWNAYTQDSGLSADPASLQRITGMLPLEWDSVREQVLAQFKVRDDGTLCLPWQWDAAQDATEKVRKLRESAAAAAEAKSKIAQSKKTDETDEIRLDKYGRPNGHPDECPNGPSNGQTSSSPASPSASSPSSEGNEMRVSSRSPRQTSGRIVAPTSDTSSPLSSTLQSKPAQEDRPDDIERIRALFVPYGKVPRASAVAAMLHEYPVEEIEGAFEEYVENLEARDYPFVEYQLCHDGGLKTVIFARRERLKKSEQEDREWKEREQQRTAAKAAEGEAWKTELKLVLPTWKSEEVFLQWKKVHPMPQILRGTAAEKEVQEALRVKYQEWQKPVAADREQK